MAPIPESYFKPDKSFKNINDKNCQQLRLAGCAPINIKLLTTTPQIATPQISSPKKLQIENQFGERRVFQQIHDTTDAFKSVNLTQIHSEQESDYYENYKSQATENFEANRICDENSDDDDGIALDSGDSSDGEEENLQTG